MMDLMTEKRIRSKIAALLGKRGGQVRAKRLTPEQRSESARRAAQTRWAKEKGKQ
jgi:hypothetical protein